MEEEQVKHPGGRPLKFKSVDDLKSKIAEYFGNCDPHIAERKVKRVPQSGDAYWGSEEFITEQIPYTITGLALALGTTRQTLLEYEGEVEGREKSEEFADTIKQAKAKCEWFAEQHLFTGKSPAGAQFSLKNNYGWVDKMVQEHEGGFFDKPQRVEVEIVNSETPDVDEVETEQDAEPSAPPAT